MLSVAVLRRLSNRVQPINVATRIEINAARAIQRFWRGVLFEREHGESILSRWRRVVDGTKENRRRERKIYIEHQKRSIDRMQRIRAGGPLREDWRFKQKPPGGVVAADPRMPLKRQIIWTNHDVALFVAVAWKIGVPKPSLGFSNDSQMTPYFNELCPSFRKKDVVRMLRVLNEQGALEDLTFLTHLRDAELDRLLPTWVGDDVRKKR